MTQKKTRHLIRITTHALHHDLLTLHTPPELATEMGRLQAARYHPADHTYTLPADALPGLHALASHVGAAVLDERAPTPPPSRAPSRPQPHRHVCTHACRHNASTKADWWRAVCAEALDTYNAELPDNPTPTDRARAAQARDTFLDTLDVARLTPAGDVDHPQQPEPRSER